jgi:hypothetical protein
LTHFFLVLVLATNERMSTGFSSHSRSIHIFTGSADETFPYTVTYKSNPKCLSPSFELSSNSQVS